MYVFFVERLYRFSRAFPDLIGNRDHSTIVYAVKYVEKNMKKDTNLRDAIETITKTIRDGSGK